MPTKKTAPTETVRPADHNGVGTAVLAELASATRTLAQAVQALNATIKTSPMTFAVDGQQYIAIAVGSNVMAFGLTK